MKLETLTSIGLAAVFSLALAMPALAQGNEAKDYQASQDERDAKKQRTMLEAFLTNYPKSTHRADVETQLMPLYIAGKDLNQAIKTADGFGAAEESADPKVKARFFTFAMEAARQQGAAGLPKMSEFADKALAADPQNLSVLMTMSRTLLENLPKEEAQQPAALEKALGYAQRAQKVTKPETMNDPDWMANRNRLHDTLALIYAGQGKVPLAAAELKEILKTNPTDAQAEYRYGMASFTQLQDIVTHLQALNTEAQAAKAKGEDVSTYADLMATHTKEFEEQRDVTIDAMAKVMALSGPSAAALEQARKILETAYKQKNGSTDGLDALIAAKKTEMVALMPLAPPSVIPTRGGGPPAGGTGAAGGARSGNR